VYKAYGNRGFYILNRSSEALFLDFCGLWVRPIKQQIEVNCCSSPWRWRATPIQELVTRIFVPLFGGIFFV